MIKRDEKRLTSTLGFFRNVQICCAWQWIWSSQQNTLNTQDFPYICNRIHSPGELNMGVSCGKMQILKPIAFLQHRTNCLRADEKHVFRTDASCIHAYLVPGPTARGDPGIQQFVVGPTGRDFTCSWDPQMVEPWEGRTQETGEMRPDTCYVLVWVHMWSYESRRYYDDMNCMILTTRV